MFSRRHFLIATGASAAVVVGGAGAFLSTKSIEITKEPWRKANTGFGDPRLDALAYAILAPNPHNRQPWLVSLGDDLEFTLFCDLNRLLPETDPPNRQITIGFGAFLELFRQAAAEAGYGVEVKTFPEGESFPVLDKRPIAHVKMIRDESVKPDPLFGYALERRTVRSNFTSRPINSNQFEQLTHLSKVENFDWSLNLEKNAELKNLCRKGWEVEVGTARTHHESTRLTRIGADAVVQNPDGISLHGPSMETFRILGILTKEKYNTPGTLAHNGGLSFYNDLIDSAAAFGWLKSPGNSREDQLNAGNEWVRLNLASTKLGIAMHPLSQLLQEFPEMASLYTAVHHELDVKQPQRVQGLFRFGYTDYPKAAPRWPLKSRLINAK